MCHHVHMWETVWILSIFSVCLCIPCVYSMCVCSYFNFKPIVQKIIRLVYDLVGRCSIHRSNFSKYSNIIYVCMNSEKWIQSWKWEFFLTLRKVAKTEFLATTKNYQNKVLPHVILVIKTYFYVKLWFSQ